MKHLVIFLAMALAMALALASCTQIEGPPETWEEYVVRYGISSSSGVVPPPLPSSSSATTPSYSSSSGGSATQSSSSVVPSSSSIAPSSSSVTPSSSSVAPSSSSSKDSTLEFCRLLNGTCNELEVGTCSLIGGTPVESCSASPSSSSSSAISSSSSDAIGGLCAGFTDGAICDSRDGNRYAYVEIGGQVWMAENLNYNPGTGNSGCYDCDTYGRLYDWATAMGIDASCNTATVASCGATISPKHRGICPSGWHLPTNAEWDALFRAVDGTSGTSSPYVSPTAGKHLKATTGWSNCSASGSSYSCLDSYGFAALPGGDGYSDGNFFNAGNYGYWWSSSEDDAYFAYGRYMYYDYEYAGWSFYNKTYLHSVRCLQD